jgi:quercetin dioxygenase-like cupin family protein
MSTPRTLTTAELVALVEGLAARPQLWRDRVRIDERERTYVRIVESEHVEVWVIGWSAGHDTGFHDHDDAAAAITVVEGEVCDERLALADASIAARHRAGETFTVDPAAIHRVRHSGAGPAVTLHAYSPPLSRMGTYEVTPEGELRRHARGGEERLAAEAVAAA